MQRRIGAFTKLAYGTGSMAFAAKDAAFINFVMFYYTQVLGVSGTLTGAAALVALLSDAITDPIVGSISDNTRSRWGRRHPFMAVSAIPLALSFYLVFTPPSGLSEFGLFTWLASTAVLLRTLLTIFIIPHTALGAELSQDYEERSVIVSYRTTLGWLAGITLPAVAYVFIFQKVDGIDGRLVGGNYIRYSLFSVVVVLVVTFISTYFTRKEIPHLPKIPDDAKPFSLTQPFAEMWRALSNRNFRWIFLSMFLAGASDGVAVTLGFYVNTYFWEFSTEQLALFAIPAVLAAVLTFALIGPLGRRFEKKQLLRFGIAAMIANSLWWYGLRLLELLPANGDSLIIQLALLHTAILVASVMLIQIMGPSIIADVVDEHEVRSGERMEGIFFAAVGFSAKSVTGLGQLLGGIIIDFVQLPSGAEPGSVAPEVLFKLGVIIGPVLALTYLVPLFLVRFIDLDRARHAELRATLDERAS